jgi:Trk K+ transport system NAD-binding subunit/nucleotide-binding universal stress UspA family protein
VIINPPLQTESTSGRSGLIVVGAGPTGLGVVERTGRIIAVTLIDKDPRRLEALGSLEGATLLMGDATSALVLRSAGVDEAYALIAATSDDTTNIEAARLAVALGVPEVLCRISDPARADAVMALGAQPVTADMAMAGALTARLPGVVVTTSEVGLGHGEILQVRVMPGSLVVGRPLSEVATREYLVGAIYRDGELLVPHGDTRVEAGDQVLLVGAPETLRAIADYFRLGAAQFPRQFGRSVVWWDPKGGEEALEEAAWLREVAGMERFHRVVPYGTPIAPDGAWPTPVPLGPSGRELMDPVLAHHPAVLVIPAPVPRLVGYDRTTALRALYDRARSPLLISRGTHPYRSILVPMGATETSFRGLELAVDIARMVGARITVMHATQPRFLGGSLGAEQSEQVMSHVEDVARLYGLEVALRTVEGNPVKEVVAEAARHQLVVAARRRPQPDTYFRPDVGLRIALRAPCSVVLFSFG